MRELSNWDNGMYIFQVPKLCSKVLSNLAIFLGLTHVHVRKSTATKLYEAIVIHGDTCGIPEENIDEVKMKYNFWITIDR